ncbi:MAG: HAD family hydrolase, partial [Salinibacter sp.]
LSDTGLPQQWRLFRCLRDERGAAPPILRAQDILKDPRSVLTALCEALGVPFREAMLSWDPGPRETDGLWAQYWYDAVVDSTEFRPYEPKDEPVPDRLAALHDECRTLYDKLASHRLHP